MTILGFILLLVLFVASMLLVVYLSRTTEKRYAKKSIEQQISIFERNFPQSFVAFDTETATKDGDVCQLGYAIVEDGQIINSKAYLIKPLGNKYQSFYTNIHGIDAKATKDSPGIADVWPEFEELILKYGIVAFHKSDFHIYAINHSLQKNGWKSESLSSATIIDTSEMTREPLRYCIDKYHLDIEFKQDALCHAVSCAKLLLALRKELESEYIELKEKRDALL